MSVQVALLGPASPRDLAHLLSSRDARRAAHLAGYRGTPVSELAAALLREGQSVEVLTTASEVTDLQTFSGNGIRLCVAPMRPRARDRALDQFRLERAGLKALISCSRADVLHAHWTYEFALAALESGRPSVVTAHDAPMSVLRRLPDPYRAIRAWMAWRVRNGLTGLVVVSPYLESQWRKQMMFRGPIRVIPNVAPSSSPLGGRHAANSTRRRIVSIGDATRLKNVQTLLKSFAMIRDAKRDVSLDLIGPGLGDSDPLRGWAASRSLDVDVVFHGRLERGQVMERLQAGRVLAHPSLEECQPMVVLEAMNLGVPVVGGRRAGGLPWTVGHGDAGLLVDVTDPRSLTDGIIRVLDDSDLRERVISAARFRVASEFGPQVVAARYMSEYEAAKYTSPSA